jgi:hypothetical protein
LVRVGDKYEFEGVTFQIEGITPIIFPDQSRLYRVDYRLIDDKYTTPLGICIVESIYKIKNKAESIVKEYKTMLANIAKV